MLDKTVSGYKILRKIGEGGMAEVYYAENGLEKPAAVKMLKAFLSHEGDILRRFKNEAKVMVSLSHPNIRQVHDYAELDGCPAIIMEYLEGDSLKNIVRQRGAIDSATATRYWNALASALNYTHKKGVVHRDIKPSNIFVTTSGEVKLLDFGIAKLQDSLTGTQTGQKMGTLIYMSPEQVTDSKHVDYRTDLYSLAVTFVHLLSGKIPYNPDESSEYQIMKMIDEKPLDMTGVPSDWQQFLAPYLAKKPADRPALRPFGAKTATQPEGIPVHSATSDAMDATVLEIQDPRPSHPKAKKKSPKRGIGWLAISLFLVLSVGTLDILHECFAFYEVHVFFFWGQIIWFAMAVALLARIITTLVKSSEDAFKKNKRWFWFSIADVVMVLLYNIVVSVITIPAYYKEYYENYPEEVCGELSYSSEMDPEGNETITVNGVSFKMIAVKGGTFTMGCTSEQGSDCYDSESPSHKVTLSDYCMGETEVTQALWKAVMGSNSSNWQGDDLPVEEVSWDDVQEFIAKLNLLTGRHFRLPTEAEWEYAARGGSQSRGYKYSGSNTLDNVAWSYENSGNQTHPVKTKQPNELGLYDMSGSVWEWCSDWYGSYSSSAQTNPTGPDTGSYRVFRGGSWGRNARLCRVSFRNRSDPDYRHYYLGFRLAF